MVLGVEASSNNDKENVLIQLWEANRSKMTEGRQINWELTTQDKPYYIVYGYNEALWSHRKQSVRRTITIQVDDDDDDDELDDDPQQTVIRQVFRNEMSDEWNTLKNKNPHKDSVISCGIRSCLYIHVSHDYYSGSPCGVMEYVSTCEEYIEKFRLYLGLNFFGQKDKMYIYGDHLYGFGRLNILEHAVLEMDQLLTVVCQKFPLPLAQYWVTTHPHTEPLRVMYQQSHTEMKNINFLDKFKQACMEMRFNRDEGLVGTAYGSRKTFFCNNIKELSITNQHLAQYASYNMSIPCFIICFKGIFPEYRDRVLEFFFPPQEMITYNHQILLNSLLATMKDYLPSFMIASGDRLGQVLMVEVISSSMHNEPWFLELGDEWNISFPRHEYERHPSHEPSHLWKLLFEEDEHIVDICSTTNSCNETATVDKLEGESSIKWLLPSNFVPMTSLPQQVEEERMVLDTSAQNNRNILGTEKDDTTTPLLDKTCQEVHKPERKIKPHEDITFDSLREQFGRPLDDAAASFGVSRSTMKRICRRHGIKRWQYGKRTMGENISSNQRRKLDDEEASRRNYSFSGMPSLQDKVVAHTSQHLNKMTVKAMYSGITIRFELPDSSGIVELEDNVLERLHLERRSFSIKYQDDEDDWILIACDKDVQECMKISRSLQKTTIKMLIDPPINNHHAP